MAAIAAAPIFGAENGASRNEHVASACRNRTRRVVGAKAAVDFDKGRNACCARHLDNACNLVLGTFYVFLPREPRIHAHGQNHVELADVGFKNVNVHIGL